MRKTILKLLLLCLALGTAGNLAWADISTIVLSTSDPLLVTFSGINSTQIGVSFDGTGLGVSGQAFVYGAEFGTGQQGVYTIGPGDATLTLAGCVSGFCNYDASGSVPFSFVLPDLRALSGTLNMHFVFQPSAGGAVFFNHSSNTLTNIGGDLQPLFGTGGYVDFTVAPAGNANIATLLGTCNSISGKISSGEVDPVPEPATALLMGLGLLGLHRVIRRKRA